MRTIGSAIERLEVKNAPSPISVRLGSKSYRDLVGHKYFSGVSWEAVESSTFILNDEQIEHMIESRKDCNPAVLLKKKMQKRIIKLSDMEVR